MLSGCFLAWCLVDPRKVTRNDGIMVVVQRSPSVREQFKQMADVYILCLLPYSFAGTWYLVYQNNDYNGYFFNVRTRSFNSIFYSMSRPL